MAERKFQRKPEGNHDNPKHHGFHANMQRLQASEEELNKYKDIKKPSEVVIYQSDNNKNK